MFEATQLLQPSSKIGPSSRKMLDLRQSGCILSRQRSTNFTSGGRFGVDGVMKFSHFADIGPSIPHHLGTGGQRISRRYIETRH